MLNKFKFYGRKLLFQWLSKFMTVQTVITAVIILKIAKYFYFGPAHAAKVWSMNKVTSYGVLTHVWEEEIFRLVLVLPIAMLIDLFIQDIWKKKPNPEAN